MKVIASLKNLRTSPRKVRLVTNSIVGMNASAALVQLQHVVKKTSEPMEKLLNSALANAENNFGLDKDNMYVSSVLVGEGAKLKRWLPRAQGRATLLLKRTSHIKLELEERIEGKNKKTKQQLDKEKADREAARTKAMKEAVAEASKEEAENEDKVAEKAPAAKTTKKRETAAKTGQDNGFLKKVFQRKSA
ncbi:MAG: 50S ribosomal protein L22 [Candidatus Moranbacteria bacterium GW2011_GWC2_37_8]|nr:MAG: 50S ribosomal protein L22 [Candidatus Moranbacteria bacterium GW2011_GWC2_37_8]KKQ62783.1 MAG: 50S ribosomal protein L22, large subunit ribosomal protein L22 [Parcubacteria group bacterium GW2011_GWC1_38_22]KKQ81275.1 MAG: 50S ribosomal protein L22 [Candidatus Moranbacteria bacterium GW2011_GWD2_38_7]